MQVFNFSVHVSHIYLHVTPTDRKLTDTTNKQCKEIEIKDCQNTSPQPDICGDFGLLFPANHWGPFINYVMLEGGGRGPA